MKVRDTPCFVCGNIKNNRRWQDAVYCSKHYTQLYRYNKIFEATTFDKNKYNDCGLDCEIIISKNGVDYKVVISKESLKSVVNYRWHLRTDGYIGSTSGKKSKLLHRVIMNNPKTQVDHINRNKFDNRIDNLRIVTTSQNQVNKSQMKNNTFGITGVTWDKSRNQWKASLNIDSVAINLGRYNTLEEATEVRIQAEKVYHKQFIPIERRNLI